MDIELINVHGSENDFFILDERQLEKSFTEEEVKKITTTITKRENGLLKGADGVLLVGRSERAENLASMRVINADGSEASMCGNGLRTVARYLAERENQTSFMVETKLADLHVQASPEIGKNIETYQVEISPVLFNVEALPFYSPNQEKTFINQRIPELDETLTFSAVAVPNPHLISFVDHKTLMGSKLEQIATYLNGKNPYFSNGVNVSFVEILGKQKIFVQTFERGVGFTNACGTAMAASSLMYTLIENGKAEKVISVLNPGGMVQTIVHKCLEGNYWMDLIGNATTLATITLSLEDIYNHHLENATIKKTNENIAYNNFLKSLKIEH